MLLNCYHLIWLIRHSEFQNSVWHVWSQVFPWEFLWSMGVSMCPLVVTMALIILWLGWRWSWIWRYPHDFSFSVTAGANLPPPFPSMRMAASCTKATTANRRRRVGKMCSQVVLLAKVGWKPWGKSRESATTMGTIYIVATWSYVIAKLIFTTNMTIGLMMVCLYIIIHIYIFILQAPLHIHIPKPTYRTFGDTTLQESFFGVGNRLNVVAGTGLK